MLAGSGVGSDAGKARAAAVITGALTLRARELTEQGSPFVIATVVRVRRPTSVEPGAVALVNADGTIEGFIGGVCAQHSVRLYSLTAIASGKPLLLRILPDADSDGAITGGADPETEDPSLTVEVSNEEGSVTVKNPCLSGGAIEAFLEPVLPAPRVLLAGDSPIVAALQRLSPEVGLQIVGGTAPRTGDLALVVAAHGRDELGVMRAALEAGVPYVGLVASRKRGAAVLEQLRAAGIGDELLAAVETPAGLDIGARTAPEIAVSILARIIEVRRRARPARASDVAARPTTAVDPICGMTVVVGADTPSLAHGDRTVYFCCMGCKLKFEERYGDAARTG